MIESIEGIVVSERPYGETSKIINVITKEHGLIGCVAKGSKTLKSDLRAVTSKLSYGVFTLYYKKDKLSTLKSVDIIDSFKNIKTNLDRISYATFLLDLAEQVIKQTNQNEVYDVLISSLKKIDEGFDPLIIMNIVELKYLEYLGVMPILDSCSICGSKRKIATLSAYRGGYVCHDCLSDEKIVSEKVIKLIRMFYYVDISKIEKTDIKEDVKKEINQFLNDYYDRYTGLYLKSKNFLKNLNKISVGKN